MNAHMTINHVVAAGLSGEELYRDINHIFHPLFFFIYIYLFLFYFRRTTMSVFDNQ